MAEVRVGVKDVGQGQDLDVEVTHGPGLAVLRGSLIVPGLVPIQALSAVCRALVPSLFLDSQAVPCLGVPTKVPWTTGRNNKSCRAASRWTSGGSGPCMTPC